MGERFKKGLCRAVIYAKLYTESGSIIKKKEASIVILTRYYRTRNIIITNNMHYKTKHYSQSAFYALLASGVTLSLLFAAFFVAEPAISHGQSVDDRTFTISQTIVDETSFLVPPANVTMSGSINGVTGGQATGTSQFSVISNNTAGYYVEITFEDTPAMIGDVSGSEAIRNYDGMIGGTTPSFNLTASTAAQFAYTIMSDNAADTGPLFLHNGSDTCGGGNTTQTANTCWAAPSTSGVVIVDRGTAAITGATSTLTFNVTVPSGATPVPTAETYTATATLSLFVK